MGDRPEFTWSTAVKNTTPEHWRSKGLDALYTANVDSHQMADWFQAFANELVSKKDGLLESTPLDMTGGPQKFLEGAAKLTRTRSLGSSPIRNVETRPKHGVVPGGAFWPMAIFRR